MPRIIISRRTFERIKDASLTGGIGWESNGKVGFRKDGAVSLVIKQETWIRLNQVCPTDPDYAINLILDTYFNPPRKDQ